MVKATTKTQVWVVWFQPPFHDSTESFHPMIESIHKSFSGAHNAAAAANAGVGETDREQGCRYYVDTYPVER